ncbi:hypothetical protein E2P64_06880 [Candidatus Bathyarchaeota archaeon]|nr:hypothetical protein E2P64_06880 [Candidatus Bathyarchaeota archaeon]
MPRGQSDIPELRLEVLQHYFENFVTPPELILTNMFGSSNSPSSSILWESYRGGRGMTPFVPRGVPAPQVAPHGISQHRAEAAYWKEKMGFDEEFLNNLRKPGTTAEHMDAEYKLARELAQLKNRSNRRKEWMFAQMLFNSGFTYEVKEGYKASIDYEIPSANRVTLASAYYWGTGASRNVVGDIQDGKQLIADECGGKVDVALFNSSTLKLLANDTNITNLLKREAFGTGELYGNIARNVHEIVGVNPQILGSFLDIPRFVCYDEQYEVRSWLTAAVSGGSTTWITVDDTSDFEVGYKLRFNDQSTGNWEERYILAVNHEEQRIQVGSPPAYSYIGGEDYVTMRKKFVPDNTFVMMATRVDGQPIAEYKQAPFGLNRHWGQYVDEHQDWDPELRWIRVQDCGIPILYQRDAMYILKVKETTGEAATSTTTTTTTSTSTSTTTTTA